MNKTIIEAYVEAAIALRYCEEHGNLYWAERWKQRIEQLTQELPSGNGLSDVAFEDTGCTKPRHDRVRITCSYHCMDPDGFYDSWRTYVITAKASFLGALDLRVTGKDYNDTKEFLADCFIQALTSEAPAYPWEIANG